MIKIETKFDIENITPHEVFQWWLNLDNRKYTRWCPEHKQWKWKTKENDKITVGDTLILKEKIDKYNLGFIGKLTQLRLNEYLQFKHSFLPIEISFLFSPTEKGANVHYQLKIGFSGFLWRLIDLLLKWLYLNKNFELTLINHVQKEHRLIRKMLNKNL